MNLEAATIAVTGATGFLGRYITEVLLGRGARVVAVVRNPDKAPELADWGVEPRKADLADAEELAEGFAGADAVVCNAALLSLRKFRAADYLDTNLRGTRNVFTAMAKAGVRRAVQVSSVVVYRGRDRGGVDEDHPQYDGQSGWRPWNAYAISKALAEQEAWRLASKHRIALTAIRPAGIYGAFDANFTRVHKALMKPVSVYPAFMRLPVVYAADVGEAIALALEKEVSIGRAYNIAGEDRTAWDFFDAWREAGGRSPWLAIPVPVPARRRISIRRAHEELGWRNRAVVEALRETLAAEAAGPTARRIRSGSAT